jgi:septal ring factor EnvC (AmiA/AmiB activator)
MDLETIPMAESDNVDFEYFRKIRPDIATLGEKVDTVIVRTGRLEQAVAGLRGDVAGIHGDISEQSVRMDRMDKRLERIERRLELVEASPTPPPSAVPRRYPRPPC